MSKKDIEEYFGSHGTGKITEIKLMNGFGFIEYEDAMDARDVVPGMSACHSADRWTRTNDIFCFFVAFRTYLPLLPVHLPGDILTS